MADPSDSRPVPVRDSLTPERIARLRQLHEAGTPGPWEHGAGPYGWDIEANGELIAEVAEEDSKPRCLDDARLIAEARNALPDLLAAIEGVRTFADRLIRMSGQHPEVVTGDVVWTLRQILAGGPDLPTEESLAAFLAATAAQGRGEGGRSAPCVPGTPSDAEASTEAPPSPQPSFPDIWTAVARVLTGTDEPGVDSAFTVEDITKAVWALLHPEFTEGETP